MANYLKKIKTPKATLYLYENTLVKVVTHENQVLDVEDMKEIQAARRKLVDGKPYLIYSVTESFASITPEARLFGTQKEVIDERLALAIVVKTLTHRIIGNFFIQLHKKHTPAKLFSNEKDAVKWLMKFLK